MQGGGGVNVAVDFQLNITLLAQYHMNFGQKGVWPKASGVFIIGQFKSKVRSVSVLPLLYQRPLKQAGKTMAGLLVFAKPGPAQGDATPNG
jgi:hypothetical protein